MGNHGGVAVFVHDSLVATRRDDLELDTVEGMWLEIAVPKSRSFLVGNFYRPDCTSSYYEKDFMVKLNGILDTASAEGKEMLLFGDFNIFVLCLVTEMTPTVNNSSRFSGV